MPRTDGTLRMEVTTRAYDTTMSRNGMTITSPPMTNITNSLMCVSEQDSFSKGDMSQKKWGITLSSQNDNSCHKQGVQHGMEGGQHPGQQHQTHTEPGAHDAGVMKREADGYIAVIGHGHKEEALKISKKQKEVHLCQAACIGD